jgi:ABC-type multidrug transport system ATPase subunit
VPILLLDEATSALDGDSEEAVRQALDRLMASRTVIAIAHRLSSLRSFDRIVVMQAGSVCEDGSPQVLVRRKGAYCNLLQREVAHLSKQGLEDRGKPAIQLDEEQAIAVRELDPTAHLALQHNQLLPQRGVLCFKLALGLEERDNQVQEQDYQRGHRGRR